MRVLIAGGHGKIALLLTRQLDEAGDDVVALIRNPDHAADVETAGGTPLVLDLEQASPGEIAAAAGSADTIVFAAGAGPGSGTERKESVDFEAAAKLVDAGRELAVKRFVMISSMGADAEHEGDEVFDVYLRAKGRADVALAESGLEYAIVRPGMLTDDQGSGRVSAGASVGRSEIPREDVAHVIFNALRNGPAANKTFEVVAGDVPIAEAIETL